MNLGRCHQILNDHHRRNQLLRISSRSTHAHLTSETNDGWSVPMPVPVRSFFGRKVYACECEWSSRWWCEGSREMNSLGHVQRRKTKWKCSHEKWNVKRFLCLLSISFWFWIRWWKKIMFSLVVVRIVDAILALFYLRTYIVYTECGLSVGACVCVRVWFRGGRRLVSISFRFDYYYYYCHEIDASGWRNGMEWNEGQMDGHRTQMPKTKIINHFFFSSSASVFLLLCWSLGRSHLLYTTLLIHFL